MYTNEALLDLNDRAHRNVQQLLEHCGELTADELNREIDGFGYPSVRLQLHHEISAQEYWIGVLEGRVDPDENDAAYPTIDTLEAYRRRVFSMTETYLRGVSADELNTVRPMMTWGIDGNVERVLSPAYVVIRTLTHLYHHQGQMLAMCRLLGKPASGFDFPIV